MPQKRSHDFTEIWNHAANSEARAVAKHSHKRIGRTMHNSDVLTQCLGEALHNAADIGVRKGLRIARMRAERYQHKRTHEGLDDSGSCQR